MVRIILLSLLCFALLPTPHGCCQDVIVMKTGDSVRAKVLHVRPYSVDYKKWQNTDTQVITVSKTYINYITYSNGTADTFHVTDVSERKASHICKGNYYPELRLEDQAKMDAKKYYKKYKGAKTLAVLSVFGGPYVIVPGVVAFCTRPREKNLGCPYPELMLREEYRQAYENKAYQIKKRQMGNGLLIGGGITAAAVVIIVGALIATYH